MSIRDTHAQLLQKLYRLGDVAGVTGDQVNYHLLGVIIALAIRDDLLQATLPPNGGANPGALKAANIGIDGTQVPDSKIEAMAKYREHFAGVQRAWMEISGYEDPPCPNDERMTQIIDVTRNL